MENKNKDQPVCVNGELMENKDQPVCVNGELMENKDQLCMEN